MFVKAKWVLILSWPPDGLPSKLVLSDISIYRVNFELN